MQSEEVCGILLHRIVLMDYNRANVRQLSAEQLNRLPPNPTEILWSQYLWYDIAGWVPHTWADDKVKRDWLVQRFCSQDKKSVYLPVTGHMSDDVSRKTAELATATTQQIASSKAKEVAEAKGTNPQSGERVLSGIPSKNPHHLARPPTPAQLVQGPLGSMTSGTPPADTSGRPSTKSAPPKSNKPHERYVDPRDFVPTRELEIEESINGQFWPLNYYPWQKGYMKIKDGCLFHE
jgi:hypothetical protein